MCSVMQLMISAFSFSETDTSSQEFWLCSISWIVGFTKSHFFTLLLAETVLQVSNKTMKMTFKNNSCFLMECAKKNHWKSVSCHQERYFIHFHPFLQPKTIFERTYLKRASSERPLKFIFFGSRCPNEMIFGLGQL